MFKLLKLVRLYMLENLQIEEYLACIHILNI